MNNLTKVTIWQFHWHIDNLNGHIRWRHQIGGSSPSSYSWICLLILSEQPWYFFFILQEIPKTPDYAPSRTFYLYTVNQLPTARMLLQNCYKVKHWMYRNLKSCRLKRTTNGILSCMLVLPLVMFCLCTFFSADSSQPRRAAPVWVQREQVSLL